VTAADATKAIDGTAACTAPTSGSCTPMVTYGSLAPDDVATIIETYDTALPGTGKTLTPSGTIMDNVAQVDVTASYAITWTPVATGVITGTAIFAPSSIFIGSGFPGQLVTTGIGEVDWITTESNGNLTVTLGTGGLDDGAAHAIDTEDVSWIPTDGTIDGSPQTLTTTRTVRALSPSTGASQLFKLRVAVPSVPEGSYSGTLTFSVGP